MGGLGLSESLCVTSCACARDLFLGTARLRSDALDSSARLSWGAKQVACWSSFFKCNTLSKICDQTARLWFPCLVTVSPPEPGTMAKRVIHSKATLTAQRKEGTDSLRLGFQRKVLRIGSPGLCPLCPRDRAGLHLSSVECMIPPVLTVTTPGPPSGLGTEATPPEGVQGELCGDMLCRCPKQQTTRSGPEAC